jgi:hypothetical protein
VVRTPARISEEATLNEAVTDHRHGMALALIRAHDHHFDVRHLVDAQRTVGIDTSVAPIEEGPFEIGNQVARLKPTQAALVKATLGKRVPGVPRYSCTLELRGARWARCSTQGV